MRLHDILEDGAVVIRLAATTKKGAIRELVDALHKKGKIEKKMDVVRSLYEREELMSTGIGNGIAIPHAKCGSIDTAVAAFGKTSRGVDFDAIDGEPVRIVFLLLTPEDEPALHIKVLSKISKLLKHTFIRERLIKARSIVEVLRILDEEEEKNI